MDHDTMTEAAPMSRARAAATLVGIAAALAASGWGLVAVLGFAAPRRPPTWDELSLLARSGSISFEAAWPVAAPFVWGLWLWATANFVVSLALALAERMAGGAAWLATAEAIAGAAGFGPMRRLLRGVVAAAFAVSLVATRPATPAGAGAAPRPAVEQVIDPPPAAILIQPAAPAEPGLAVSSLAPQQGEARTIRHTVRAGQVLSRISEWYYKDWKRYPRLAADNGLPNVNLVPTGRVLTITEPARTEPLPTSVAPPADGEGTHVVRAGETFPSIAAAVYGDAGYADDIYWRNWAAIRDVYRPPAGLALVLPIIPDAPSGPRATPRPAPSSPPSPAPAAADERGPAAPEPPILARPWRLVILPPPTPVPAPLPAATPAPAPTPAIVATAAPPPATAVAPAGAAAAPAAPTPRLAVPVDAEDAALAAVSLAAGFLAGLATARRARAGRGPGAADPAMTVGRRRALRRPSRAWRLGDPRFSPLGPAARAALDRTTGAARRGLSLLTRRRPPAGDDADPRMTTPGRLLAALAEAGWPGAAVATLEAVGGTGVRCDVRLDPTAARDPKQELPELLAALRARLGPAVAGDVTDDGFLSLALAGLPPAEAGAADDDTVPPPPLLHIGQADGAPLAASPAGVGGGLLLAGTGAATAFDAALVSLLDAYAPADVRLALIAPEALGAPYRGAAQLVEPPVPPGSPAAHSMLEALLAGPAWDRPRLLLAVAEPAAAAGPLLRALAAENGARGIDVLVAAEDAGALDPALVAACRGRVLGRLASAALSRALAGREGAEALAPGAGWWLFNRRPPRPIALLAVDDEDRRAALAASDPAAVAAAAEPPADDQTDTPTAAVAKPEVEIEGEVAGEEPVAAMEPTGPAPSDAQEPGPTPLTPPPGALAVRLLGPLQISVDGRPAPDLGPRVAELLLYLILHPAGAHKPALAEALWPDAPDDENQRDALSQAKRNLARWLERVTGVPADAAIAGRAPGEPYRLAVPRLWTDLAALTDHLALADETADDEAAGRVILEALRLYRGRVGEGLRAGVGADEDWSEPHAEAAARTVAAAGARLAAAQARAGRHAFAIRLYETLHGLAIYHEDEEVLRHELDCYAEVGDARGLQRAYADFRAWARRHWAAEPEAETRAHYRRLRARLGPPPLPAPPAGGEDERAAAQ